MRRSWNDPVISHRCVWLLLAATLGACERAEAPDPPVASSSPPATLNSEQARPPSFLDEPPPPPESDSFVLSGGTLVGDPDLFDAVVVVQRGSILATGRRGATPVPPESIGIDASGRFIVPKDRSLIGTKLTNTAAELEVYRSHPLKDAEATLYGTVRDGVWIRADR